MKAGCFKWKTRIDLNKIIKTKTIRTEMIKTKITKTSKIKIKTIKTKKIKIRETTINKKPSVLTDGFLLLFKKLYDRIIIKIYNNGGSNHEQYVLRTK